MSREAPCSPVVVPYAVVECDMHSHHIDRPAFAEWIAGHTATIEALQWAHKPDFVLVEGARRVAGEWHPVTLVAGHSVSLRHLTSGDVSYRLRR